MRAFVLVAAAIAWAALAAAQTPDVGNERTKQNAGQSGAAASHTITPGVGEPREITSTATGSLSLSAEQRKKLTDYFAHPGRHLNEDKNTKFTVSVGAAVPRQVALAPLAPELEQILPTYRNDQYVVVDDRLVIVIPDDRRIVAIIPTVKG